jgi:hypothetical protein
MKSKFIKGTSKHPTGLLRELITKYEQWKQTTGYRQSFQDSHGTPSRFQIIIFFLKKKILKC